MRIPFPPRPARHITRFCSRCRHHQASTQHRNTTISRHLSTLPELTTVPIATIPTLNQSRSFSHTSKLPLPNRGNSSNVKQPTTHYSFFPSTLPSGPPPEGHFPIDTRLLRSEFLRLQAKYHPDKHPQQDKPRAEAVSASINEAYKTLSNPLLRAQYLLSLQGVDVANDETLKVEEPELLMVVLEAHEEIERASNAEDLKGLTAENEERIATCEGVLEGAFHEGDIEMAKREAVRLRYWVNIRQAIHDWEEGKPAVLHH
ncbi:molecular chaperone [Conoideocrella luteorostrata]|uniref:Molecular chaperone n=1 Tax=Conoideocrella luteorostrata TaxID=1105319 RepID=A0AAJ0CM50_9HYPO|nr:molecular chaperone [Conoideocrella luteorostrata]